MTEEFIIDYEKLIEEVISLYERYLGEKEDPVMRNRANQVYLGLLAAEPVLPPVFLKNIGGLQNVSLQWDALPPFSDDDARECIRELRAELERFRHSKASAQP